MAQPTEIRRGGQRRQTEDEGPQMAEGLGGFGWACLFAIAILTFALVSNF